MLQISRCLQTSEAIQLYMRDDELKAGFLLTSRWHIELCQQVGRAVADLNEDGGTSDKWHWRSQS
jgi:hypothetical protein